MEVLFDAPHIFREIQNSREQLKIAFAVIIAFGVVNAVMGVFILAKLYKW